MADASTTNVFDPNKKVFFDTATLDNLVSRATSGGAGLGLSLDQIAGGRTKHESGDKTSAVDYLRQLGLGGMSGGQILANKNNADFITAHPELGKAYSYSDLAKTALRSDPNFDPSNTNAINSFASEIQKRGYTNTDSADISNLATNFALKNTINQAQNPTQGKTADQLAGYQNSVKGVFNQVMGRDPTANETDFFSKELAGGTSPYELEQALQTAPEYVQKQNDLQAQKNTAASNSALDALNTNLLQTQQQAFQKIQPQIIGAYLKAGRLNSSGVDAALANTQKDLEQQRQSFIANAGYQNAVTQQGYNQQGFVNNQNNAFNQYLRQSDPSYQQQYQTNAAQNYLNYQAPLAYQQRQYGLADIASQRAYDLQNYNMQKNDYMNYLNSSKHSNVGQLLGTLAGAGIGAYLGGPTGRAIGASAGASIGGSAGSYYDNRY